MKMVVRGAAAERAAKRLEAIFNTEAAEAVTRERVESLPPVTARAIDPVAVATLVLSVPPAIDAIMNLVDRIAKRRKMAEAVAAARAARDVDRVSVHVVMADGSLRDVATLGEDELLDIWSKDFAGEA